MVSARIHTLTSSKAKSAPFLETILPRHRLLTRTTSHSCMKQTQPIMKKWNASGRKWGTLKETDANSRDTVSKVVRRHLDVKTQTFLFK